MVVISSDSRSAHGALTRKYKGRLVEVQRDRNVEVYKARKVDKNDSGSSSLMNKGSRKRKVTKRSLDLDQEES